MVRQVPDRVPMMPSVVIARSIVVWLLVRVVIDVLGDIVGDLCLCQIVS